MPPANPRWKLRGARAVLLILIAVGLGVSLFPGYEAISSTIHVPGTYPTIQAAVDAAAPGDTVLVGPGAYDENITIDKDRLTLESVDGPQATSVRSQRLDTHTIDVVAAGVTIEGFTLQGAAATPPDNPATAPPPFAGVCLRSSSCVVRGNVLTDNDVGILLTRATGGLVTQNEVRRNGVGVNAINASRGNAISANSFSEQEAYDIFFRYCFENTVTLSESIKDIWLFDSDGNTITENSDVELIFWHADRNLISRNTSCTVQFLACGLGAPDGCSRDNVFYLNGFDSPPRTPCQPNSWSSPEPIPYTYWGREYVQHLGNRWPDYTGLDGDGDGVGDTAYYFALYSDDHPLVEPIGSYVAGGTPHTVGTPQPPSGKLSGGVLETLPFSTGGSTCSQGHVVQYRFDWDDGNYSNWSSSATASHAYSAAGTYTVKAQARCAAVPAITSSWSPGKTVTVSTVPQAHTVTAPSTPTGTSSGDVAETLPFSTGGSTCSQGHSVQYRFDWDNGSYSNWSSSTTASCAYSAAGTYTVKAQARCATQTSITSGWSPGKTVTISATPQAHTVTAPSKPTGTSSGDVAETLPFSTGGSACSQGHSVQYRFDWDNGSYSSWSASATASYAYSVSGTYTVKAQARCATQTSITSGWSEGLLVAISDGQDAAPIARSADITGQPETMYPHTTYTINAEYYDPDGRDDLKYCYLRLRHPTKTLTIMWRRTSDVASAWAGEEGAYYLSQVEASAIETTDADGRQGYRIAWTFQIDHTWPKAEEAVDLGGFAEDNGGLTSGWQYASPPSTFLTLEIGAGNRPPVALIRHYPSGMSELFRLVFLLLGHCPHYDRGQEVTFDATWSTDSDGTITAYDWDFGDGYGASGKIVEHTYSQRGEYEVRLAVTDGEAEANEFTETIFIAIPTQSELASLGDAADHLLATAEGLLENTLVPASESAAEAAHEYLTMMSEDAIDALFTFLTALMPGPKVGAGDGFWKILLRHYGYSAAMEGGRFVAKAPFVDFMHALRASDVPYASVLARIRAAVTDAKSRMSASRSGILDELGDLDAADVRAYETDLRLRALGNSFMVDLYYATAAALHTTAEIARHDRDSWTLFAGKICWGVGITAGVAAGTAAFGPIFGKVAGFSSFGSSMYESLQSLEENARYCVMSQHALRRGGTEDAEEFPINVLAAIRENVTRAFLQLREREAPMTVEGQILSIGEASGTGIRVRIKNTGDHAGRFRVILQTEARFTSYELFRGAGRYYIVPYVAHYPEDEFGWDLLPGQEMTVEIDLPEFAERAHINLLGESESGIYGLDSMSMVHRQEARSWVGRVWNRIKLQWGSPIEILVKAADGNATGESSGSMVHDIRNSYCDSDKETIWLLSTASTPAPLSELRVLVTGTGDGTYDLSIERDGIGGTDVFSAVAVPISISATHEYYVNWDVLARGGQGVTLQIDINGDGIHDETILVGPDLDGGEMLPVEPIPPRKTGLRIGPNPVSASGTAFFCSLPEGATSAEVLVFSASGRLAARVALGTGASRFPAAGAWIPVDQTGEPLPNGAYVCVLVADGRVIARSKMVILR